MQIPIISRRGQTKPYGSIPRINWDHPLAAGLVSYNYDCNGFLIDLVTGGQSILELGGGAAVLDARTSPFGAGTKYGPGYSNGLVCAYNAGTQKILKAAPFSIAFSWLHSGAGYNNDANYICLWDDTVNDYGFMVRSNTGGSGLTQFWYAVSNGGGQHNAAGDSNNAYHSGIATADTSSAGTVYFDGKLSGAYSGNTTVPTFNNVRLTINGTHSSGGAGGSGAYDGFCYYVAIWDRSLSAAEARTLHDDPYCFLIYPEDEIFSQLVGAAGGPPSGTLATTEAPDVAAFTGQLDSLGDVSWGEITPRLRPTRGPMQRHVRLFNFDLPIVAPAEITGTLDTTEAADIAAFAGQVVIAATLDTTEATDIAAFVGSVTDVISGTLDITEAPDVAAFNGNVTWTGTLATTEAPDTAAFNGAVTWTGTLATTEAPDVAAFNGSAAWTGTLATTEAPDVAAFNGTVAWTGTLAVTEATDIAAFNGSAAWTGTLATTEAADIAAFNGQVVIAASLVVTEGQDVANFTGSGVGTDGTLATTEAADIAAFAGQVVISATLATVEAADVAAFAGNATWTGTLATTEAKDVMAFVGSAGWTGTLAVTEATDVAAFAGQVRISAALAVTETQDIAAFNGFLVAPLTGTLAVTEAQDIANFAGLLVFTGIVASLDAVERADTARFVVAQPPAAPGDLQYGWPDVIVRRRL